MTFPSVAARGAKDSSDKHPDVPIGGEEFATVMEVVGTQRFWSDEVSRSRDDW